MLENTTNVTNCVQKKKKKTPKNVNINYVRDSLTFWHKIILNRLTCH